MCKVGDSPERYLALSRQVNPWEIEMDPEEAKKREEERRKAEEAAARAQ